MSEPIVLNFGYDPRRFRRALMAFWTSAVPAPSFRYRVFFWICVWLAIPVAYVTFSALGASPLLASAGILAGFVVGFIILQRVRMRKFYRALGAHWAKTGEMTARFDETGMHLTQTGADMRFDWLAVDDIVAMRGGGTVFRIGMSMISIPDKALPAGMDPDAFRDRLDEWRGV